MNYQIRFSRALVSELMNNRMSYDMKAVEDLLTKIEQNAIKNIESRTVISIGGMKLLDVVMDDVIKAFEGDDDG